MHGSTRSSVDSIGLATLKDNTDKDAEKLNGTAYRLADKHIGRQMDRQMDKCRLS